MTMGTVTREHGVLKLVHPGGFVEVHTQPIIAVEVMNRNPRHCVARPDVFKFPWIVVHPDSVLNLGSIFYIIPNHSLYQLLQAYEARRQPCSLKKSRAGSWAQETSKYQLDNRDLKRRFPFGYWLKFTPKIQIHDRHLYQELLPINCWNKLTSKHKNYDPVAKQQGHSEQFKEKSKLDSSIEVRPFHAKPPIVLKSCLFKEDSDRKCRGLRVKFSLPGGDDRES